LFCGRLRRKTFSALARWVRATAPPRRTEISSKLKGMALVMLNKFRRRPFTIRKALRRWTLDWDYLLKRIIFNLAYETSINE
jgi:hypothetical protein